MDISIYLKDCFYDSNDFDQIYLFKEDYQDWSLIQPTIQSLFTSPKNYILKENDKGPPHKIKKVQKSKQKNASAYALYFRDVQEEVRKKNPNASFGEISKIISFMWNQLSKEKRLEYKRRTDDQRKEQLKKLAYNKVFAVIQQK
uniref:HMG box domain-containing protein n=1 Tax=Strongyloides venezuelensis TaxID=75913 RepID=A0A0K0F4D7_STRVS